MAEKVSRKSFLRTMGLAGSGAVIYGSREGIVIPEILPSKSMGNARKVNLALIGIANQGNNDAKEFIKSGLANIVAVCDVDLDAAGAQEIIKLAPKAKQFRDFRIMFDQMAGDIDAVQVAIPDFAHFPVCMAAMQLGKSVYVEKPMCRTFLEAELMSKMAASNPNIVTQVGNQGHSGDNYFQFKAWKDAGIIKDVTAVTAFMNGTRRWHPYNPDIHKYPEAQPLPKGMTDKDWDTWLTTAAFHDFNEKYHPGNWRGWYDFGLGALGDWGAHILDTIHEFLDLGLPYEIEPVHIKNLNDFFFPLETTLKFRFPSRGDMPPVDITWYDGVQNLPPLPEGYFSVEASVDKTIPPPGGQPVNDKPQPAKVEQKRPESGKVIYSKDLTFKGGTHSAPLFIIPEEKAKEMASSLPDYPKNQSSHYVNFLKSVLGEEKTRSPFQKFAPLAQLFSLGIIAIRRNKKLILDRERKEIINDKFANAMLADRPPRKGWESYYNI
ncbi:MAG TPA: Gfo/Idh/MocA family oxidoreductase [Bacteroidales bacterium]|nr:Gfo/Idh/MocA family oxidoreductase [Bacteroidales bacterium]